MREPVSKVFTVFFGTKKFRKEGAGKPPSRPDSVKTFLGLAVGSSQSQPNATSIISCFGQQYFPPDDQHEHHHRHHRHCRHIFIQLDPHD